VGELLACEGLQLPLLQLGIPDRFIEHGSRESCLKAAGLDLAGCPRASSAGGRCSRRNGCAQSVASSAQRQMTARAIAAPPRAFQVAIEAFAVDVGAQTTIPVRAPRIALQRPVPPLRRRAGRLHCKLCLAEEERQRRADLGIRHGDDFIDEPTAKIVRPCVVMGGARLSAMVSMCSILCGAAARKLRLMTSAPSGSTPNTRNPVSSVSRRSNSGMRPPRRLQPRRRRDPAPDRGIRCRRRSFRGRR